MTLIPGNNSGLCPQRQTHFSLSLKPTLLFQVHGARLLNVEHVLKEKERDVVAVNIFISLYVGFLSMSNPLLSL